MIFILYSFCNKLYIVVFIYLFFLLHPISVLQVDTASIFLVDSTYDLGITFHIQGYKPTVSKFPRAESFSAITKMNGLKFSLTETLIFHSDASCKCFILILLVCKTARYVG